MRTPLATQILDTPQKSARIPANSVGYIVVHHAATTSLSGLISLVMGGRTVSSTIGLKDAEVVSFMDESFRAWSLSSQLWDSISLSCETCNSGGAAEGWPISEASYYSLARVIRDWCDRYGIPCDRTHIIGHREVYSIHGASYATACPGGIDLDRLVRMANELGNSTQEDDMTIADPYIWTKDPAAGSKLARYAILDLSLPEGSFVTTVASEADLLSWLVWDKIKQGAPLEVNGTLFDRKIAGAKLVTSKRVGGGSGAVDPVAIATSVEKALLDNFAELAKKIDEQSDGGATAVQIVDLMAARLKA